jgi:hypothetical protein
LRMGGLAALMTASLPRERTGLAWHMKIEPSPRDSRASRGRRPQCRSPLVHPAPAVSSRKANLQTGHTTRSLFTPC